MRKPVILVAEGDDVLRRRVRALLLKSSCEVMPSADVSELFLLLRQQRPLDLLIMDASCKEICDGLEILRQFRQQERSLPIIVLASRSSEDLAMAALKLGVVDYFRTPFTDDLLLAGVQRALSEHPSSGWPRSSTLCSPVAPWLAPEGSAVMIGESAAMWTIKSYLLKVAAAESTALITGETGTGKELVADLLHRHSARRHQPLVRVNGAAIPESLVEGELFGYERGAFEAIEALLRYEWPGP